MQRTDRRKGAGQRQSRRLMPVRAAELNPAPRWKSEALVGVSKACARRRDPAEACPSTRWSAGVLRADVAATATRVDRRRKSALMASVLTFPRRRPLGRGGCLPDSLDDLAFVAFCRPKARGHVPSCVRLPCADDG